MKIFHIIRNQANISMFKEIVQECIHSGIGDKVFISSGFFQEIPKGTYSASHDADSIGRSFLTNTQPLDLYLLGVHNAAWNARFCTFVTNLSGTGVYNIFVNGVSYTTGMKIPISKRHHAKVFVYQSKDEPLLEIVGSSNFTRTAYGTTGTFNKEVDLIICNSEIIEVALIQKIQQYDYPHGIMILNYDELNKNSIIEEMNWIRDNLF